MKRRRVYVAIRDRNWGTVPTVLSNVHRQTAADSFRVTFDADNRQGDVHFAWRGTIQGDARGRITFTMDGVARSTFLRNRIGLCVLHPMRECAGRPCVVEKADGALEQGVFPKTISPHQPFLDVAAIGHQIAPGVRARVRLTGDVFEMEDQRNWTDASFKTYSTPLALPFPVLVEEGTRVAQSITLAIEGDAPIPRLEPPAGNPVVLAVAGTPCGPLPRIGLGAASHGRPLGDKELARLAALNLAHLRVDLGFSGPGWEGALHRAAAEARSLGIPLEVALFLSGDAGGDLRALAALIERERPAVCTWLVFDGVGRRAAEKQIALARQHLTPGAPGSLVGTGTDANFAELNRDRPPTAHPDVVSYSINPQVHATDEASLVEALEGQAATLASARRFAGGLPLAASPITLKPRFNPVATAPAAVEPGELPPQVDPRQASLFGAGWTVGSVKYVSQGGAHSATYYETSGWRGVMETDAGSPLPDRFPSLPGAVFPLYHVLADVGELAGGQVVPTTASAPLLVDGVALCRDGRTRVIVANLGAEFRRVSIRGLDGQALLRLLDETNAEEAMRQPEAWRSREGKAVQARAEGFDLDLGPYAIARLDVAPGRPAG